MKSKIKTVALTLIAAIASGSVMAGGGLAAASTAATTFQTWLYSFIGICRGPVEEPPKVFVLSNHSKNKS